MRKKLKMRQGSKAPKKYADGGSVRRGRGISQGLRSGAARQAALEVANDVMDRTINRSAVRPASALPLPPPEPPLPLPPSPPVRSPVADAAVAGANAGGVAPTMRQRQSVTRSRSRELTADELNDREMTRILNDRSLAAARAGRNMYRKGGMVKVKGKKC